MLDTYPNFRKAAVRFPQEKGVPMRDEYEGSWLATASGGMWSIENPREDQVHLRDIAAGLSRTVSAVPVPLIWCIPVCFDWSDICLQHFCWRWLWRMELGLWVVWRLLALVWATVVGPMR